MINYVFKNISTIGKKKFEIFEPSKDRFVKEIDEYKNDLN